MGCRLRDRNLDEEGAVNWFGGVEASLRFQAGEARMSSPLPTHSGVGSGRESPEMIC